MANSLIFCYLSIFIADSADIAVTWPDPRVRIMSEMLVSLVTWAAVMTDGSLQSHAAQVSLVTTHAPRSGNGNQVKFIYDEKVS